MSTERTFWTGLYLRKGLQEIALSSEKIRFTGCPAKPGESIDLVSVTGSVNHCVRQDAKAAKTLKEPESSEIFNKFRQIGDSFLTTIRSANGTLADHMADKLPLDYTNNAYDQIHTLTQSVEMSAAVDSPLSLLIKKPADEKLLALGYEAVTQALNYLGVRLTIEAPLQLAYAASVYPLQYITARPSGSHTIVVVHDDFLSNIARALDLINEQSELSDYAMYPMESFIFAIDNEHVSIARMRIQVRTNGFMPGPFESKVIWKGTREEWDKKVQHVFQQAQAWAVGASCRNTLRICETQELDVQF